MAQLGTDFHLTWICADSFLLISIEDVTKMRALFSEEFFQRFHMAYRNYEERLPRVSEGQTYCDTVRSKTARRLTRQSDTVQAGEWLAARDMLPSCNEPTILA